jgi:hypothetical protein
LVSAVVPVHNRPRQLREAVESVLAQDHRPAEVIVVDDGSTDETGAVAEALCRSHPEVVRAIRQRNAGSGLAREAGRQAAAGEFVQYLDSDDVLLPGKFAAQVAALREHPECGAAYGYTRFRRADGTVAQGPWKGSGVRRDAMFPSFLQSRWWDTPTPLYRAAVCAAAGPWSDLRLEEDWEYDCRVAALGVRLCFVPQYVAEVRDHDGGRLCRGAAGDPARLRERARAHALIYGSAQRAGIASDVPEMRHFARELFLLCRQCGAAGLAQESRALFALARAASGPRRGRGADFLLYRAAAGAFGWRLAGRAAALLDALRGAARGAGAPGES